MALIGQFNQFVPFVPPEDREWAIAAGIVRREAMEALSQYTEQVYAVPADSAGRRRSDYDYLRKIGLRAIDAFHVAKSNDTPGRLDVKIFNGPQFDPRRCEITSGSGMVLFRNGAPVRQGFGYSVFRPPLGTLQPRRIAFGTV